MRSELLSTAISPATIPTADAVSLSIPQTPFHLLVIILDWQFEFHSGLAQLVVCTSAKFFSS